MTTYSEERRRRIEQFAHYLWWMGLRRRKVIKNDDCFIIFDEHPSEDVDPPKTKESAGVKLECLGGSDMHDDARRNPDG